MKIIQRDLKKLISWLTIVFTLSLIFSCSSKPENAIIGKWKEINGTGTIEFFKDGTVIAVDEGMSIGGSYKFIDKDRIKMEFQGFLGALAGPIVAKVSISDNELTFIMPDGTIEKYKRIK